MLRSLRTHRERKDARALLGVLETCMRTNFAGIESSRSVCYLESSSQLILIHNIPDSTARFAKIIASHLIVLIRPLPDFLWNKGSYREYVNLADTCDYYIDDDTSCLAYLSELEKAMAYIRDSSELTLEEKKRFFKSSNTNLGSTALCLSGGATFGYCMSSHTLFQMKL